MRWPWVRRSELERVTGLNSHLNQQISTEQREAARLRNLLAACRSRSARLEAEIQDARSENRGLRSQLAVDMAINRLFPESGAKVEERVAS